MAESPISRSRRIRNLLLFTLGVLVTLSAAIGITARPRIEHWLRTSVIATLEARLDSVVELENLSIAIGPVTRITGGPLTIRHRSRLDVAPLVHLERFETTMTWRELLRRPRRVDTIVLTGLAIAIPPSRGEGQPRFPRIEKTSRESSFIPGTGYLVPGAGNGEPRAGYGAAGKGNGVRETGIGTERGDDVGVSDASPAAHVVAVSEPSPTSPASPPPEAPAGKPPAVIIGRITADAATLTILPRETRKLPRRFVMHRLTVRDITTTLPMAFETVLENPQPHGRIETRGTFGPWNVASPAHTPLEANYRFVDADLSTIKGIAGILQSTGTYSGVLERIVAVGTTTMPGFDLKVGGRPMPLTTAFTVIVDGTNGNTYIQPAEAILGARTPIRVTGGIVKAEDRRGRTVDLATTITNGRLEEVLALVADGTPAMRGRIGVIASLLIPPGPVPVVEKMVLDGRFTLAEATFTSQVLQARLDELSRRAQGRPGDTEVTRVVSAFTGRFRMADGVIRFPALSFDVDGARVDLSGAYTVRGQGLHFDGRIRLQAGVSQMVMGRKRWLLRPFDGLFRRNGATEFPIHIRGSVAHPQFGVDVKETVKRALLPGR